MNDKKNYILIETDEEVSVTVNCEVYITPEERIKIESQGYLNDEVIFSLNNDYVTVTEDLISGEVELAEQDIVELTDKEYQEELKYLENGSGTTIPLEESSDLDILKFTLEYEAIFTYKGIGILNKGITNLDEVNIDSFSTAPIQVSNINNPEYSNMQIIDKKQSQTPIR